MMPVMPEGISKDHAEQIEKLSIEELLQLTASNFGGSLESRLTGAAVATVVARMVQLNDQDQQYLFECVKDLSTIEDREDAEDTMKTIIEILDPCKNIQRVPQNQLTQKEMPRDDYESWLVWISKKLRDLRAQSGLTQQQLAEKAGLPQSHISRLEAGKHSPSNKTLAKIAGALGIDVKQLTLED